MLKFTVVNKLNLELLLGYKYIDYFFAFDIKNYKFAN